MKPKNISTVGIKKDNLKAFMSALTRNVFFIKSASFIGGLLFLLLSFLIIWGLLEMIANYREFTKRPWATLKGVEPRSAKEFQQAINFHGTGARLCEWDDAREAWVFYRDGKPCKVFAYKEKP